MGRSIIPDRADIQKAKKAVAWLRQYGVFVVAGLFVFAVYPKGTAMLAVLVGVVLLCSKYGRFILWARDRRKALAKAEMDVPDRRGLRRMYLRERKREKVNLGRWTTACTEAGLATKNKQVPVLWQLSPTLTSDFTASLACGSQGISIAKVAAAADLIRETVGCKEVVVTPTTSGCADIAFNWSDPMGKTSYLSGLPMSKPGTIAYGIRRDGTAATIEQDKSVLIGGLTGFGKSNIIWTMLADLVRKEIPLRLYVSDPKGGIELTALAAHVGDRMGNVQVMQYASTAAETVDMVTDVEKRMRYSQSKQQGRKHTPTADNPLCVVLLDELLPLHEMIAQKNKGPLGKILYEGRASGYVVWANAQTAHESVLGVMRNFIPQRLSVKTKSQEMTDTILGTGATARGALCHLIDPKHKGVGFSEADSATRPDMFRAPLVKDADIERIAVGAVPHSMPTEMPKAIEPKQPAEQSVYFIEAQGTDLVKIGIAAQPKERLRELQTASPHRLAILATMPGGKPKESHLHRQFAAHRAAGEWFHRTPELDELIAKAQAGDFDEPGEGSPRTALRHVRNAPASARDWVTRNARSITTKRDPEPSNAELATMPAG